MKFDIVTHLTIELAPDDIFKQSDTIRRMNHIIARLIRECDVSNVHSRARHRGRFRSFGVLNRHHSQSRCRDHHAKRDIDINHIAHTALKARKPIISQIEMLLDRKIVIDQIELHVMPGSEIGSTEYARITAIDPVAQLAEQPIDNACDIDTLHRELIIESHAHLQN